MDDFILRILNISVLNPYDMNRIERGLPVRLVLWLLCIICPGIVFAMTVRGVVTDPDNRPLEFANITLYNMTDTAFVGGCISDVDGKFMIEIDSDENLFFKCSYIGYEPFINIASPENSEFNIILNPESHSLQEVTVSANIPQSRLTASGLITNVANTMLSTLGTADDVLDYIPLVVKDGMSYSVFGHGKPIFYINGRKMRDPYELVRIPSGDIISIEVITNPGAQYPASTASVIKIKTRLPVGEGLGGTLVSEYRQGHRSTFNELMSLNYRKEGLDIFAQFSFAKVTSQEVNDSYMKIETDRTWEHHAAERISSLSKRLSSTVGANYVFNPKHSAGVRYTFNAMPQSRITGVRNSESFENGILDDRISSNITIDNDNSPSHLVNAYYIGTVNSIGINFNVDYVDQRSGSSFLNEEASELGQSRLVSSESMVRSRLVASKLFFEIPLLDGNLTIGAEYSYTDRHDNYDNKENLVKNSNTHLTNTNVAPFLEYSRKFPFGNTSIGVRFEHLDFDYYENGLHIDGQSRSFNHIYPSIAWSKRFGVFQVQSAYNLYTSHPSYSELSGNVTYANRYQYQTGNPYLKSGINHNVSFTAMWNYVVLNAGYDDKRDAIMQSMYVSEDDPSVSVLTYENVPSVKSAFAYLSIRPTFGIYRPQLMLSFTKQWFSMESMGQRVSLGHPLYAVRLNNIFMLPCDWMINVVGAIGSKASVQNHTERRLSGGCSAVVYKWFLKKSLQVSITANDIFNTQKNDIDYYLNCAQGWQYSHSDSRKVIVALRYNFNTSKSKYRGQGAGQSEKDRL